LSVSGDLDGAGATYPRAVDLLAVHGRRYDAARAADEWSTLLREHGRDDEADAIAHRAGELRAADTAGARAR
jgi:hypothetical protein